MFLNRAKRETARLDLACQTTSDFEALISLLDEAAKTGSYNGEQARALERARVAALRGVELARRLSD